MESCRWKEPSEWVNKDLLKIAKMIIANVFQEIIPKKTIKSHVHPSALRQKMSVNAIITY